MKPHPLAACALSLRGFVSPTCAQPGSDLETRNAIRALGLNHSQVMSTLNGIPRVWTSGSAGPVKAEAIYLGPVTEDRRSATVVLGLPAWDAAMSAKRMPRMPLPAGPSAHEQELSREQAVWRTLTREREREREALGELPAVPPSTAAPH